MLDMLSKLVPSSGIIMPSAKRDATELLEAARSRLRQAMRMRDAAAVIVNDKRSAVSRVEALIQQADAAEEALDVAEEQSSAFTATWAESGADPDKPAVNTRLKDAATAAASEARAARIAADGAATGLPAIEATLTDAKYALDAAQSAVNEAVAGVLAALVEPALVRAERAGQEFRAAADQVQVMLRVLSGHWFPFSNDGMAAMLLQRLRDCAPAPLPARATDLLSREGERFIEGGRQYVALGNALLTDADAK